MKQEVRQLIKQENNMAKMWEIREGYDPEYMGRRGEESEYYDGFEDGCEHGYKKAMKEMRMMGMRDNMGSDYKSGNTSRMNNRYMPPYPSFRDDDDDDDYEDMNMRRRRRDSRGRYM